MSVRGIVASRVAMLHGKVSDKKVLYSKPANLIRLTVDAHRLRHFLIIQPGFLQEFAFIEERFCHWISICGAWINLPGLSVLKMFIVRTRLWKPSSEL